LFKEFHLDEPWDSPHNLRLLPRMPRIYTTPDRRGASTTFYKVFIGKGAAFEGKQGLKLPDDFPDSTSKTILLVEAGPPVRWTKPEDLPFDPARPLPPLAGPLPNGLMVALLDASVRRLDPKISKSTLRAAITRNAGDQLGPDW